MFKERELDGIMEERISNNKMQQEFSLEIDRSDGYMFEIIIERTRTGMVSKIQSKSEFYASFLEILLQQGAVAQIQ